MGTGDNWQPTFQLIIIDWVATLNTVQDKIISDLLNSSSGVEKTCIIIIIII